MQNAQPWRASVTQLLAPCCLKQPTAAVAVFPQPTCQSCCPRSQTHLQLGMGAILLSRKLTMPQAQYAGFLCQQAYTAAKLQAMKTLEVLHCLQDHKQRVLREDASAYREP